MRGRKRRKRVGNDGGLGRYFLIDPWPDPIATIKEVYDRVAVKGCVEHEAGQPFPAPEKRNPDQEKAKPGQGITFLDQEKENPEQEKEKPGQEKGKPEQGITFPDREKRKQEQGITFLDQEKAKPDPEKGKPEQGNAFPDREKGKPNKADESPTLVQYSCIRMIRIPRSGLLCLIIGASPCFAQMGVLDPTLDGDGLLSAQMDTLTRAEDIALQPDGKIVLVGYAGSPTSYGFAITRHEPDGSLDTTFGTAGEVHLYIGDSVSSAEGVVIQPDGKILMTGTSHSGTADRMTLLRLNTDGSLDTSFGNNGVTTLIGSQGQDCRGDAIAVRSNGKIIAVGTTNSLCCQEDIIIECFNYDGSIDSTFGVNGNGLIGPGSSEGHDVVIQPDDKIVVVGTTTNWYPEHLLVIRLLPDGTADLTFSNDGIWTSENYSLPEKGYAVALQSDGKILAAGAMNVPINPDYATAKLNGGLRIST